MAVSKLVDFKTTFWKMTLSKRSDKKTIFRFNLLPSNRFAQFYDSWFCHVSTISIRWHKHNLSFIFKLPQQKASKVNRFFFCYFSGNFGVFGGGLLEKRESNGVCSFGSSLIRSIFFGVKSTVV